MHYTELGYDEYEGSSGYIQGPEWKEIKDFFYKYCGPYQCGICGVKRFLLLHKRSYKHLTMHSLNKRFFYFRPLIIWWLRRNMVYLCHPCNGEVHFNDDGSRVKLDYNSLMRRERIVRGRHRPMIIQVLINTPIILWKLLVIIVKSVVFTCKWLYENYALTSGAKKKRFRRN